MKRNHEFQPVLTWDESALVCRRCDQFEDSWQHEPPRRWWHRLLRRKPTW